MADQGITTLLEQLDGGDEQAFARLIEQVYDELRVIARNRMRRRFGERVDGLTMQPTGLANDVVVELLNQHQAWQNTEHFFAIATRLMMRQLADYARQKQALKRGQGNRGASLDAVNEPAAAGAPLDKADQEASRVMQAIEQLHELDARKAEVVTLHVICSLSLPRVASLIGVSTPTVERDWRFAKAWLASRIDDLPE